MNEELLGKHTMPGIEDYHVVGRDRRSFKRAKRPHPPVAEDQKGN